MDLKITHHLVNSSFLWMHVKNMYLMKAIFCVHQLSGIQKMVGAWFTTNSGSFAGWGQGNCRTGGLKSGGENKVIKNPKAKGKKKKKEKTTCRYTRLEKTEDASWDQTQMPDNQENAITCKDSWPMQPNRRIPARITLNLEAKKKRNK